MSWMRTGTNWRAWLWRGPAVAGVAACLTVGWWLTSFTDRELPAPHFSAVRPPVSADRCATCHSTQSQSLQHVPHTVTLQPASSAVPLTTFGGLTYHDPGSNSMTDRFQVRDRRLWRESTSLPDPVPIDWIFGSGRHARTPVSVLKTPDGEVEVIEHRLSWYPDAGLDLTLGLADKSTPKPGWHGLGKRLNPDDTADCFGCHSSWLPTTDGRLDLSRIQTGVHCSRCHQEGEAHMESANAGHPEFSGPRWSELSPLDSIRRCGECHRRDDQMTPFELRPGNPLLVRFAPVGLSQSRCFTQQDRLAPTESGRRPRFDCITCHDPHRAAETSEDHYVAQCANCHTGRAGRAPHCSDAATSQRCLDCHMPKIEVQPHLRFTDHWIRKRRD